VVEASPGTTKGGAPEGPPSFFAHDGWTEVEIRSTPISSLANPREQLAVVHLGADVVDAARRHLLPTLQDGALDHERREAFRRVRQLADAALCESTALTCGQPGPADCIVHRPGLRSTAFDFSSGHFVGLHIDDHQKLPLARRSEADVLFAINIGLSHRYLVFVPLTVAGLLQEVFPLRPTTSVDLKNAFLEQNPDAPVLRIRLAPGDAYLCGPQNLIHDGATNEGTAADVALLMSGDYR
jgi:hypothetical protein